MGSVEKRIRNGRTTYVVRWRDDAGRQRKKSFARKLDADRYRTEIDHKILSGAYVDPAAGKVTFKTYAEGWRAIQPLRPNTARRYKSNLTSHAYPAIGGKQIAAVRPSDVQALAAALSLKLEPSSVRSIMSTVATVFRAAVHDRVIGFNPCERMTLPEIPRQRVVPISVETVEAIAAAVKPQYRALVVLGAGTGLRRGELFGLRLDDVDFLRRTVKVERQVQRVAGKPTIGPPKTRGSQRTVPIGDIVVRELSEHVRRFPPVDGVLFTGTDGRLINDEKFRISVWNPALTAAGATGTGMHQLRHFFASVLIAAGQSVKVVSDRLGHSDASMTLNVYSHLWPADEDKTRQAVDQAFSHKIKADVPPLRPAKEA